MNDKLQDIIKTASDLIRFKTVRTGQKELVRCLDYISDFFDGSGLEVIRKDFNGMPLAIVTADMKSRHELCLCGHLDVVPAHDYQFTPDVESGRLYGRGAGDMKGPLAALMYIMRDVVATSDNPRRVSLLVVSDEETGGRLGAKKILEEGYKPKFFLTGEPTTLRISNKSKGLIELKITTKGKSGHGSRPWEAKSAIDMMVEVALKLEEVFPTPKEEAWRTTAKMNIIRGGSTFNVIPGECEAHVDMRYLPESDPDEAISKVISALGDDVEVRIVQKTPSCSTPDDEPNVVTLKKIADTITGPRPLMYKHAASDARYFSEAGIPAVAFGPSAAGIHSDNEWIELKELDSFYRIMQEYTLSFCKP